MADLGIEADPALFPGLEELPSDLLSSDLTRELDLDDLLAIFDGDEIDRDIVTPTDGGTASQTGHAATPSTSESGNRNTSGRSSSDKEGMSKETKNKDEKERIEEEKRLARMKRNRENAHLSRLRKKEQLMNLQRSCQELKKQNSQLNLFIQRLAAENCLLRHHLKDVCQAAKLAVPDVPTALKPSQSDPKTAPVAKCITIHDTKKTAQRSDGASGASSSQTQGAVDSVQPRNSKRKKIGGTGAAFLTLFSLFLFMSPISIRKTDQAVSASVGFLPEGGHSSSQQRPLLTQKGRSLMMVHEKSPEEASLSDYLNETVHALLSDQEVQELPKHALANLKDIAPAALALDMDKANSDVEKNILPAATTFPALTERIFESAGLEAPQMCKKVFEFHADDVPAKNRLRSKRSIEKYVMGTHGFKGRSSGLKLHADEITGENEEPSRLLDVPRDTEQHHDDDVLLPARVQEPLLVSLLLPANSSRTSRAGISAIDQLYVVILNPQNTFSTYACDLPRSLIV